MIRKFKTKDLDAMKRMTVEAFYGLSADMAIEKKFGKLAGTTWQERKTDAVVMDIKDPRTTTFVDEQEGRVVGYVTCHIAPKLKLGHIGNLAVSLSHQGKGSGRALIERAFTFFRDRGMEHVRIETLAHNELCMKFYPDLGFQEVGRQVLFCMRL